MAKNKRTFDQLSVGCYFWSASPGGIDRCKVHNISVFPNDEKMRMGISWYMTKEMPVGLSEFNENGIHWFTNKEDARNKAIELAELKVKELEDRIVSYKQRVDYLKEKWNITK